MGCEKESAMKNSQRSFSSIVLLGALLVALVGCQKQEGPVEKAGKEVDKATEKVGNKIEQAGDNIKDAVKGDKK
jgi:hypothetical protein